MNHNHISQPDTDEQFDFVEMADGSGRTDYPESLGFGNERMLFVQDEAKLRALGGVAAGEDLGVDA